MNQIIRNSEIVVVNSYDMLFSAALTRKGIEPKNFNGEDYALEDWLQDIVDSLRPYEPEEDDLGEWDDDLGEWDPIHGGYSRDPRPYWDRMEE